MDMQPYCHVEVRQCPSIQRIGTDNVLVVRKQDINERGLQNMSELILGKVVKPDPA